MDRMTSARIRNLIEELDRLVDREGALIRIRQVGGGPDESALAANRLGFLRGGIELMKAAFVETKNSALSNTSVVPCGLDELLTEDSDIGFDCFERVEDLSQRTAIPTRLGMIAQLVFAGVLVFLLLSTILGIITIIRSIF